jgi:hypothetical protein
MFFYVKAFFELESSLRPNGLIILIHGSKRFPRKFEFLARKERNDLIFNHKVPSLVNWKQLFKNEVKLHLFRIPIAKRGLVMNWLNSL